MGRQSGLGRGLGALIPSSPQDAAGGEGELRDLPIEKVVPNRYQPRSEFEERSLDELTASVSILGVLQPVLVRRVKEGDDTDDTYELIAGERRWRAARRAGLHRIPALVRDVEHQESLEQALVENLHREDLNPVEEGAAFRQLIDDFGLSHEQIAERVGRSRSAVTNTLRLLQLPPEVLQLMVERHLGAGHGRALLALEDVEEQRALAQRAATEMWSVRRVEDEVKRRSAGDSTPGKDLSEPKGPQALDQRPAALLELEDLLSQHLDTRVSIQLSGRKGRLLIDFGGIEDLERLYRVMVDGREKG